MHPAPSVILFTVFSGLGFGLLAWLGIGLPDVRGGVAFAFFFIAYALAVGGLAASAFHLGNPQRALKAFSQWRSSWLSREAWLAVLALCVMGLYAIGAVFFDTRVAVLGWIGTALSLGSVAATSMIYTQLRTVPRWNHWSTPVMFLALSVSGGGFLAGQIGIALPLLALTTLFQIAVWIMGDTRFSARATTLATATGLGGIGSVRSFEPPHTGSNYLMHEMIYVVARKHALKLRSIAVVLMGGLPVALLLVAQFSHAVAAFALLSHLVGVIITRWLFFAEAEHVVGLYYGKR